MSKRGRDLDGGYAAAAATVARFERRLAENMAERAALQAQLEHVVGRVPRRDLAARIAEFDTYIAQTRQALTAAWRAAASVAPPPPPVAGQHPPPPPPPPPPAPKQQMLGFPPGYMTGGRAPLETGAPPIPIDWRSAVQAADGAWEELLAFEAEHANGIANSELTEEVDAKYAEVTDQYHAAAAAASAAIQAAKHQAGHPDPPPPNAFTWEPDGGWPATGTGMVGGMHHRQQRQRGIPGFVRHRELHGDVPSRRLREPPPPRAIPRIQRSESGSPPPGHIGEPSLEALANRAEVTRLARERAAAAALGAAVDRIGVDFERHNPPSEVMRDFVPHHPHIEVTYEERRMPHGAPRRAYVGPRPTFLPGDIMLPAHLATGVGRARQAYLNQYEVARDTMRLPGGWHMQPADIARVSVVARARAVLDGAEEDHAVSALHQTLLRAQRQTALARHVLAQRPARVVEHTGPDGAVDVGQAEYWAPLAAAPEAGREDDHYVPGPPPPRDDAAPLDLARPLRTHPRARYFPLTATDRVLDFVGVKSRTGLGLPLTGGARTNAALLEAVLINLLNEIQGYIVAVDHGTPVDPGLHARYTAALAAQLERMEAARARGMPAPPGPRLERALWLERELAAIAPPFDPGPPPPPPRVDPRGGAMAETGMEGGGFWDSVRDAFDPAKNGVAKAFDPNQNGVAAAANTFRAGLAKTFRTDRIPQQIAASADTLDDPNGALRKYVEPAVKVLAKIPGLSAAGTALDALNAGITAGKVVGAVAGDPMQDAIRAERASANAGAAPGLGGDLGGGVGGGGRRAKAQTRARAVLGRRRARAAAACGCTGGATPFPGAGAAVGRGLAISRALGARPDETQPGEETDSESDDDAAANHGAARVAREARERAALRANQLRAPRHPVARDRLAQERRENEMLAAQHARRARDAEVTTAPESEEAAPVEEAH